MKDYDLALDLRRVLDSGGAWNLSRICGAR
jgi:hypothetical protein